MSALLPSVVVGDILPWTGSVSTIVRFACTSKASLHLVRHTPLFFGVVKECEIFRDYKAWPLHVEAQHRLPEPAKAHLLKNGNLSFFQGRNGWFSCERLPLLLKIFPTLSYSLQWLDLCYFRSESDVATMPKVPNLLQLFISCGQNVKALHYANPLSAEIFVALKHLPSLVELSISLSNMDISMVNQFATSVPRLKYLDVVKVPRFQNVYQAMLAQIAELKYLKTLGWGRCVYNFGDHRRAEFAATMPTLRPLTRLLDAICQPQILLDLAKKCPNLRRFKLGRRFFKAPSAAYECLRSVASQCPDLLHITLDYETQASMVPAELPDNVRLDLIINWMVNTTYRYIDELGDKLEYIRVLSVESTCSGDKLMAWLGDLDKKFPNLKNGAEFARDLESKWSKAVEQKTSFSIDGPNVIKDYDKAIQHFQNMEQGFEFEPKHGSDLKVASLVVEAIGARIGKLEMKYGSFSKQSEHAGLGYTIGIVERCVNARLLKLERYPYTWHGKLWTAIARYCLDAECAIVRIDAEHDPRPKRCDDPDTTDEILRALRTLATQTRRRSIWLLRMDIHGQENLALYYLSHCPRLHDVTIGTINYSSLEATKAFIECSRNLQYFKVAREESHDEWSAYVQYIRKYLNFHQGYHPCDLYTIP